MNSATFLVLLFWVLTTTTPAAASTSTTPPAVSTTSSYTFNDEEVCSARFINSDNAGEAVLGIAAVLAHRRPQGRGCGIVSGGGLQATAALLWAVNRLNGEGLGPGVGPFIPGLRIGLRIYDDCSQDPLASLHTGKLLSEHPNITCTPTAPPLLGVMGTAVSHTTMRVASLLADTNIPLFGISATASVLGDKKTYPTFFRNVPSDLTQSKVLVDIVKHLNWTYVVGIYTTDSYGTDGFREFKRLATQDGICVFKEKSFWHTEDNLANKMETFVRELLIALGNTRSLSLGVVFFGHDIEANALFKMINDRRSKWHDSNQVDRINWVFSDGVGRTLELAKKVQDYSSKQLSISPATPVFSDVLDFFFQTLNNPHQLGPYWESLVREYLREEHNCLDTISPVENCQLRNKIREYDYVSAALDSLYSLAALLHDAHEKACGQGAAGACQALLKAVDNGLLTLVQPQPLNYTKFFSADRIPAEFSDRVMVSNKNHDFVPSSNPLYIINSASSGVWRQIGNYCNGTLTFESNSGLSNVLPSECGTNCLMCRQSDVIRFAYQPGDVIVLGLYSVSSPITEENFSCGDYRGQASSVVAMLAFLHTLEVLSSESGIQFGALVLDDCYNQLTASVLIADLFSGKTTLQDPTSGETIDMSKVVAVVGSQSSSVTLSALNLLKPLRIPTISYSATSPDLDDRFSFPYFLRTVPSDTLQAQALVDLVKKLNVTYVAAMHERNNYGVRGMEKFVELAEAAGICVEKRVPVGETDSLINLMQALQGIRNNDAMVVVTFVLEATAANILDSISGQNLDIIFLASEAWGLSATTLQGHRGVTARGSLVLTVDTSKEAGDVKMVEYLQGLTTDSNLPWMGDFWEHKMRCNLPDSFTNNYNRMCPDNIRLSETMARSLAGEQKVVQTINAVTSVATALRNRCGNAVNPASCMLGLSALEITNLTRDVTLQEEKGFTETLFRPYLSNGNGNVGFVLHNIQKQKTNDYSYVKVGQYHPTQGLTLINKDILFYDLIGQPIKTITSFCQYKDQCNHVCGLGTNTTMAPPHTTASYITKESDSAGLVAAVVMLALLCVALIVLLAMIVFCARRRGKIPLLGVVRKSTGPQQRRMSASGGRVNMGFTPPSMRTNLPLPAIPRIDSSIGNYVDPDTLDMSDSRHRISQSSGTPSSMRRRASPSLFNTQRSSAPGFEIPHQSSLHSSPNLQHMELLQQLQEQRLQLGLIQQGGLPTLPPADRPRAGSMPQIEHPNFQTAVRGRSQQRGSGTRTFSEGEASGGSPVQVMRPRSQSHDAAFRNRLGALSDEDHQLLMKHLHAAHQQSLAQRQSQVPRQGTQQWWPQQQQQHTAEGRRISAASQQRQTAALSPIQSMHSVEDRFDEEHQPVPIRFQNAPSFCSSRSSLLSRAGDNPSLLYLHPISSQEQDMYLQVLPDELGTHVVASSAPNSPDLSMSETTATRPSSLPSSLIHSVTQQASPAHSSSPSARSGINFNVSLASSPVMSPRPVFSSPESESSGAVFISPSQEYPPERTNVTADFGRGVAAFSKMPQSPAGGRTDRTNNVSQGASPRKNQVLTADGIRQLLARQGRSRNNSSSSLEATSPKSPGFSGVVVRDSSGALILIPCDAPLSTQQEGSGQGVQASVFASHSPPEQVQSAQNPNDAQFAPTPSQASNNPEVLNESTPVSTVPLNHKAKSESDHPQMPNDLSNCGNPLQPPSVWQVEPNVAANISRTPRMGVDALSTQRRLAADGTTLSGINNDTHRHPAKSDSQNPGFVAAPAPVVSAPTRIIAKPSARNNNSSNLHNAQGVVSVDHSSSSTISQKPASAGTPNNTSKSSPTAFRRAVSPTEELPTAMKALERVHSYPYVEAYMLNQTPPVCGSTENEQNSGSGNSYHTSGDSGNGEEIATDAMDREVAVMC